MPSWNLDINDKPTLLRILSVLIDESEAKEIRFDARAYDTFDKPRLCVVDFDKKNGQIVLKLTSTDGRVAVVQPEAHQWTLPLDQSPTHRQRTQAEQEAQRRSIPTDEELADLEERARQNAQLARDLEDGKSPMRIKVRQ